ncbi:MAG: gamma-glutamyltransferase family protein, partial [Sphingomonas sp.]
MPALAAGGMVAAKDPRGAEAGREILRAGGNATDAAIAMMLALSVVEPQSSGIGGGGFLVRYDPKTKRTVTVDGRETAPAAAKPDRFMGADGKPKPYAQAFPGGDSVGVPGNVRLAALAHGKWGRLPWAKLFDPAIRYAEQGYALSFTSARYLGLTAQTDRDFPALRALYWAGDAPKAAGTLIRNPALGALLRRIAREGPDAFYTGENARAIIAAAGQAPRNPATITQADLTAYRARERPPVCGAYRGYRICGMGPPSSGATTVLQVLGMLERFDLKGMGKDDPRSWHLIGEAMLLAYADRDLYLGDADFVAVPVKGLIDPAYVAGRSRLIAIDRTLGRYAPGTPPGAPARTKAPSSEVPSTTNFVAADGAGEVVTMTSTVEGLFGSQLVANGYILNNEMTDF